MTPQEAYNKILEIYNATGRAKYFRDFLKNPSFKKEIDPLKEIIIQDAIVAVDLAIKGQERWIEAEEIIKTNPKAIFRYVAYLNFLSRWEEAEENLLKGSPNDIFDYYYYFIRKTQEFKDRTWKEAEPKLSNKMSVFHQYVIMTEKPNELYEQKILNNPDYKFNPKYIYDYSCKVLNDRWKEAEPIILKNPDYAAKYCTKFRLPVPEEIHNQIIAEVALTNKNSSFRKKFLENESKRKKRIVEYLKELIEFNKISKETTVEELINNI